MKSLLFLNLSTNNYIIKYVIAISISALVGAVLVNYILFQNASIVRNYNDGNYEKVKKKIKGVSFLAEWFSVPPFNKNVRTVYNNLNVLYASICYYEGKTDEFLSFLKRAKYDEFNNTKFLLLALYYRATGKNSEFEENRILYKNSSNANEDMIFVLEVLSGVENYDVERFLRIIKGISGPCTKKLIKDNGIEC